MLINMFLEPGVVSPDKQLYPGQGFVQQVLLLMAMVCVPWLLITKPYLAWKDMKRIHSHGYTGLVDTADPDDVLEAEEEGNGRAVIEDANGEEVRNSSLILVFLVYAIFYVRNITTLEKL